MMLVDHNTNPDPTGTASIRRKFRSAVRNRLNIFRGRLHKAIIDHDLLGLDGNSTSALQPAAVRCEAFAFYLSTATEIFIGNYGQAFIKEAWNSGIAAIGTPVSIDHNWVEHYCVLFEQERVGIVAVLVQWLNRAVNELLTNRMTKVTAWRILLKFFDKILVRFDALVNMVVIKVHNLARIESLREDGTVHYGVKAERIPVHQTLDARKKLRRTRPTKYVELVTAGDEKVCPRCEALEGQVFSYAEVIGLIPLHVNCLPGDSFVSPIGRIAATSKRTYEGDLIVIRTATGNELKATPNHPVLTDRGWVGIQFLNKGSRVVCYGGGDFVFSRTGHDYKHVPTRIEDVTEAFAKFGSLVRVPLNPVDFHGDGVGDYVDVVYSNSPLKGDRFDVSFLQKAAEVAVQFRNLYLCAFKSLSTAYFFGTTALTSSYRGVGRFGENLSFVGGQSLPVPLQVPVIGSSVGSGDLGLSLFGGHSTPENSCAKPVGLYDLGGSHRFGLGTDGDSFFHEKASDASAAYFEPFSEVAKRLPFPVVFDDVVSVERVAFSGHVYNLETSAGCYVANNIVTHNCRCAVIGHYLKRRLTDAGWEESKHPRGFAGRFASKGVTAQGYLARVQLSPDGIKLAQQTKDQQADNSVIKRMFELHGLSLDDYKAVNKLYYAHNVSSEGSVDKAIEQAWNDPRLGGAMRLLAAWNEWQVVHTKNPNNTLNITAIEKRAIDADKRGEWKAFQSFHQAADLWDNPYDYVRYLKSKAAGDTWFYRKGEFDRSVISTTTNKLGARSGGSHFVPDKAKSFADMRAMGYRLLAGARGLIGVTAGDEGEHLWFRPDIGSSEDAFSQNYIDDAASWEENLHPRVAGGAQGGGRFTSKGGTGGGAPMPQRVFGSKNKRVAEGAAKKLQQQQAVSHYGEKLVRLKKTSARAFSGDQIETKIKLSKLETDAVGESVALSYLRSIGFIHAHSANIKGNNYPIDIFADHRAIELKSGQVSNTKSAQKFRITLGQPGKAEMELLKRMTKEERLKHNTAKLDEAVKRKLDVAKNHGMSPVTMMVLFNPDKNHADIFVVDGYHKNIRWNSKELASGYVGSFLYS